MSKAREILSKMYEYSWSDVLDAMFTDINNDTEIDDEEMEDIDDEDFDDLDAYADDEITADDGYPNSPFPDLHYKNIDNYYNQVGQAHLLTAKSCQMCANNEKMHGLRYCRSCYDSFRYKKRKIFNAPVSIVAPFSMNQEY